MQDDERASGHCFISVARMHNARKRPEVECVTAAGDGRWWIMAIIFMNPRQGPMHWTCERKALLLMCSYMRKFVSALLHGENGMKWAISWLLKLIPAFLILLILILTLVFLILTTVTSLPNTSNTSRPRFWRTVWCKIDAGIMSHVSIFYHSAALDSFTCMKFMLDAH